jgi:PilZ domain
LPNEHFQGILNVLASIQPSRKQPAMTNTITKPITKTDQFLAERRKHPRHAIEAQVTVLFPEFWNAGDLKRLWGWTHNVSETGVCFSLPFHLTQTELLLHIDYEGMGAEYVLTTVVKVRDMREAGWQYHCQIERTLSSVDPFECFLEATAEPVGHIAE